MHVNNEIWNGDCRSLHQRLVLFLTGPALPQQPTELTHTGITFDSATIQWLVNAISYTPETYTIYYGTSQVSLQESTNVMVEGTTDITAITQMYSKIVIGLEESTTYYYQIVAENSVGSTESAIAEFTTPTQGDYEV